jgi:hypothetical protein
MERGSGWRQRHAPALGKPYTEEQEQCTACGTLVHSRHGLTLGARVPR